VGLLAPGAPNRHYTHHEVNEYKGLVTTPLPKRGIVLLPATRRNIILYAVDKQLNKDSRNQATDKSYPQPEHIFPYASKPNYQNA
jgi:hypothetical protein